MRIPAHMDNYDGMILCWGLHEEDSYAIEDHYDWFDQEEQPPSMKEVEDFEWELVDDN